jgi:arylsulfatase A-like enzyme
MRNVLFITADQWRGDSLGVAGHPCVRTPNLDALAGEGVSFSRHYAQSAPCGPSRASLHTGMYQMNHRCVSNGTPLDPRFTNMALEVRKLGLDPSLIGYTDTAADPRGRSPLDPALQTYCGLLPGYRQLVPQSEGPVAWLAHLKANGFDVNGVQHLEDEPDVWDPVLDHPEAGRRGATFGPAPYPANLSDTAFSTDEAIEYIESMGKQSWFLHLSLLRPHPPYIVPAPYHDMYQPEDGPEFVRHASADEERRSHPYTGFRVDYTDDYMRDRTMDMSQERYQRQLRATYWGMMSEVDAQLGRLFATLKSAGVDDNTLIVFTSDHGEQLFDHWQIGKLGTSDQGFHVPLIIRDPDLSPERRGVRVDPFTENVDIMPTILSWLGAPVPLQVDGRSLMEWLEGDVDQWRDAAFVEIDFRDVAGARTESVFDCTMDECNFVMRRGERWKYVHFAALPPQLFDMQSDPAELNNLAASGEHASVLAEQAQLLLSHKMRYADRTWTHTVVGRKGLVERV